MKSKIKKTILVLAMVFASAIVIRIAIGEPCYIPSASMEPTILTGDWLWINKITYGGRLPERWSDIPLVNAFTHIKSWREADAKRNWGYHRLPGFGKPEIGDIVVFNNPENMETLLVKRVAEILYEGDTVYPDFTYYDQLNAIESIKRNAATGRITLDQNYYFMSGDNRDNSRDSRFFGYVPEQFVIGQINRGIVSIERTESGESKFRAKRFFFKVE